MAEVVHVPINQGDILAGLVELGIRPGQGRVSPLSPLSYSLPAGGWFNLLEKESLAGIIAFRHPAAEQIYSFLYAANIHIMTHVGRLRVSLHGYNTLADVERFLEKLTEALQHYSL